MNANKTASEPSPDEFLNRFYLRSFAAKSSSLSFVWFVSFVVLLFACFAVKFNPAGWVSALPQRRYQASSRRH